MKSIPARLVSLATLTGLTALAFTGCTKQDRDKISAKTSAAYAETKDALGTAWDSVKTYTFEKRDEFSKSAKEMTAKMDTQLHELRANYSDEKASASRKAAMADLKSAEADYKQKLDAVGRATADTWDSAKQNVIAAWDRLQASYKKAREDSKDAKDAKDGGR